MATNQQMTATLSKHLRKYARCPQTNGMPMRCTKAGFDRGCAAFKLKAVKQSALDGRRYARCADCTGYPDEVEFLSLDQLLGGSDAVIEKEGFEKFVPGKKEKAMAKKGTCELCGNERSLKKHHDMHVCTTCSFVLTAASNTPGAVLKALEKFDNVPMAELCETDGAPLSLEAQRAAADNGGTDLEALRKRVDDLERLGRVIQVGDLVLKFSVASCQCENAATNHSASSEV